LRTSPLKPSAWVCVSILILTLVVKIFGLVRGGGFLSESHPFLPGTYRDYVWGGVFVELAALAILMLYAERAFLAACLGLAVVFIGYHAIQVELKVSGPCPCLGGLLSHWRFLTKAESTLSFILAAIMGVASFLGLCPKVQSTHSAAACGLFNRSGFLALGCWLLAGTVVCVLWNGHPLGGSESIEMAKSLQGPASPQANFHDPNNSPPWYIVGNRLLALGGTSLLAGRLTVLVVGCLLPLTWMIYWSSKGVATAPLISTLMLWFGMPFYFTTSSLEAPAYAVATAALIPLVIFEGNYWSLLIAALIALIAISIKTTSAIALIAAFVYIAQSNWRKALWWAGAIAILTLLGAIFSGTMGSPDLFHFDFMKPANRKIHLDPIIYVNGWLVSILAVFAVASRYLKNDINTVVPWLASALAALLFHLVHCPFADAFNIHLMIPVVTLAGVGAVDLWRLRSTLQVSNLERKLIGAGLVVALTLWGWQREMEVKAAYHASARLASSTIATKLQSLDKSGNTIFVADNEWKYAVNAVADCATLTVIPWGRLLSGGISDHAMVELLAKNQPAAFVINQEVLKHADWSAWISSYSPVARDRDCLLFVRRELQPTGIDLNEQNATLKDLGL